MKKNIFIFFYFLSISAFATHERAGEITYRCLGGYTYSITITTYTKASSCGADQCSLIIHFGDNDSAIVDRTNGQPCPLNGVVCDAGPTPSCLHCGTLIGLTTDNMKINKYSIIHTYPGPSTYTISMTDNYRNNNIINIPNSGKISLSIQDLLVINPLIGGCNNSPILLNPPIDKACIGKMFIHNPGAVDPDGDSLSYKLGVCFQDINTPIKNYFLPSGVSIDPVTGDFTWNSPILLPSQYKLCYEYNFAIDIEEWRKISTGQYIKIGTVRRDMQVNVCDCKNDPPLISHIQDTCILAGTNLTFTITATDPGNNIIQTFTSTGGPFMVSPSASFITNCPIQSPSTGVFSWTPGCEQVKKFPYLVTCRAVDDGAPDNVALADFETFFIKVIAPAPKNLSLLPECTKMNLRWNPTLCNPSANPIYKYNIYRKVGCDTLEPTYCETGMPASWGYQLIATVPNTKTTYTDNNGGAGLIHGNIYTYRVVAYYLDGAESYVSDPVCGKLVRDVPIITNVDVVSTNGTKGVLDIKWLKPLVGASDYDTTILSNHGPYRFDLLRSTGYSNPISIVQGFSSPYFATLNNTSWLDSILNTQNTPYTYQIQFSDTSTNSCPTQNASSVFLTCNPSDNQIQISWNEHVPWTNYRYDVYKLNSITNNWDSLGTTTQKTFTDTNLVNGVNYCYKVKSIGAYPDTTLLHPLINWSQQLCCSPIDLTPPCPTQLSVDSSCSLSQNILTWTNPNNSCCDDALYYVIYHNDSTGVDYNVLDTIFNINTTTYLDDSLFSIAGCYAVTSVDSFGNESLYSNIVCIDNCPFYELPNVFTPNEDGTNDYFTPLHPYKYISSVDIKIYNRWGTEVFRTFDPEIRWDGKSVQTKMNCSDGVYYYVCIVYDIRLQGIVPHVLTGYVHLLRKS